uniref:DNA helicase n=1 Tax=Rhabditophanes sp. KR3021 TaxID=114890 RepID=A0AC35UC12_9BILA
MYSFDFKKYSEISREVEARNAAKVKKHTNIRDFLLEYGIDPNMPDDELRLFVQENKGLWEQYCESSGLDLPKLPSKLNKSENVPTDQTMEQDSSFDVSILRRSNKRASSDQDQAPIKKMAFEEQHMEMDMITESMEEDMSVDEVTITKSTTEEAMEISENSFRNLDIISFKKPDVTGLSDLCARDESSSMLNNKAAEPALRKEPAPRPTERTVFATKVEDARSIADESVDPFSFRAPDLTNFSDMYSNQNSTRTTSKSSKPLGKSKLNSKVPTIQEKMETSANTTSEIAEFKRPDVTGFSDLCSGGNSTRTTSKSSKPFVKSKFNSKEPTIHESMESTADTTSEICMFRRPDVTGFSDLCSDGNSTRSNSKNSKSSKKGKLSMTKLVEDRRMATTQDTTSEIPKFKRPDVTGFSDLCSDGNNTRTNSKSSKIFGKGKFSLKEPAMNESMEVSTNDTSEVPKFKRPDVTGLSDLCSHGNSTTFVSKSSKAIGKVKLNSKKSMFQESMETIADKTSEIPLLKKSAVTGSPDLSSDQNDTRPNSKSSKPFEKSKSNSTVSTIQERSIDTIADATSEIAISRKPPKNVSVSKNLETPIGLRRSSRINSRTFNDATNLEETSCSSPLSVVDEAYDEYPINDCDVNDKNRTHVPVHAIIRAGKKKKDQGLYLIKPKIIKPDVENAQFGHLRRSARNRIPPLNTAYGQKAVYKTEENGTRTLIGVTEASVTTSHYVKYQTLDMEEVLYKRRVEQLSKKIDKDLRKENRKYHGLQ